MYPSSAVSTGVDLRGYSFGRGFQTESIRQVSAPFTIVVPIGRRFVVDLGAAFASTRISRADGSFAELSRFTDTQLRASYVFGRDAVVATVLVNVPTADEQITLNEFAVVSAIASPFLSFPVTTYGAGTSVTAGLALAQPVSSRWSLGIAGGLRLNSGYQPFEDAPTLFSYREGLEGRLRVGAEGLIGSSALTLGLTYSTYGQDEFRAGDLTLGGYQSGDRLVVELGLSSPVGSGGISASVWDYHRFRALDSLDGAIPNQENLFGGGAVGWFPLGPDLELRPGIEWKVWSPNNGTGRLIGAGMGLGLAVGDAVTLLPEARVDVGSFETDGGAKFDLTGWGISLYLRYSL